MRKAVWVEQVQANAGLRFRDRTIAIHIETAINTVLGQVFNKEPFQWDQFSKPFEADVVGGHKPYALIPEQIIQTPDLAKGVRRIYAGDQENGSDRLVFVPIPSFGRQLFQEVKLDQVDDTCGYDVRFDRVLFYNLRFPIKRVTMDLVIPFSRWSDDDDFPIPSATANLITDMAVKTLMGMPGDAEIYKKAKQ